ncbi:DNA/RNA non-specific endonuclease [Azospirillum sp. SYSU D00513]|uniref:DNA/RNA non-specific endonuclease n=1 Tax=Azospirillum sp. SYSU D00513 TaxID=2812561 RepID=UPI001A97245A|nr:DNA/RNA non-specific endonuclease [Azospirillum sp. SYSU D00513]
MMNRLAATLVVLLTLPTPVLAGATACPENFAGGQAPDLTNTKLAPRTREVCFRGFAVLHSGLTRTPLYAAERITRDGLKAAADTPRKGNFYEETRLPAEERARLDDYVRSGMDRGHLVPAASAVDQAAQQETFSLANIVPQNAALNRGLWAGIEGVARDLARKRGEVYVVTGAIFQGERLQRLKGRVFVPTHLFKAIYDPKRKEAAAYVTQNEDTDRWEVISVAELERRSGVDPFPTLPASVKASPMALPAPRLPGQRRSKTADQAPEGEGTWTDTLKQLLR